MSNNQNKNDNKSCSIKAPYNFVSFSDDVYKYKENELVDRNDCAEDLYTGEIAYTIKAETPIIIDNGNKQFCRDPYGQYAIPGSTIRGLIRNNVQILGFSSLYDDIDDYELMYRNVANGVEYDNYNTKLGSGVETIEIDGEKKNISVLKNVKAGYIVNENGRYAIYRTVLDSDDEVYGKMNYYVVSERKIIHAYLRYKDGKKTDKDGNIDDSDFAFSYFIHNGENDKMQHVLARFKPEMRKGKKHYVSTDETDKDRRNKYIPYYDKIMYKPDGKKILGVKKIEKDDVSEGYETGYVISSGYMNEKKAIYIIPEVDITKEPIRLYDKNGKESDAIKAFKIDYNKREKTLKKNEKKFFDLPKDGEIKPVFYIEGLGGKTYFGFTPRLRLFYDSSVKCGLNTQIHSEYTIDYAKALFGYSDKLSSYKSRVSFSDAKIAENKGTLGEKKYILLEPKPTSYLDYLKQDTNSEIENSAKTYNSNGFELRGVKQYWLHEKVVGKSYTGNNNDNVESSFTPLKEGTTFTGKIRFQNLKKDEMGLLLWAISLDDGMQMNVGKAKAYGYGRISLFINSAKRIDKKKAYGKIKNQDGTHDDDVFGSFLSPFEDNEIDIQDAIDCYKGKIIDKLNLEIEDKDEIEKLKVIHEFFMMKDSRNMPDAKTAEYMFLKEYQQRKSKNNVKFEHKNALPTIEEVIEREVKTNENKKK